MTQTTLLLVDDDPMVVESLAPLLERSGFHVLIASNGDETLSKVQPHHPDVIVLNVLMPRVNELRRALNDDASAPRVSQLNLPNDIIGIPPETREVYAADDAVVQPQFFDLEFSGDNKYLVMQFWDGMSRFAAVALDSGQVIALDVPELDPYASDQQVSSFSWRP